MKNQLSIFPLSLVVFPASKYPLHIFEERYKKMIALCLNNNEGFVITSVLNNQISKIGTYVDIEDVIKKYKTGESDIIVKGVKRVLINDYKKNSEGYYVAVIVDYPDIHTEINYDILNILRTRFISILEKISYRLGNSFWETYEKNKFKSYKLAEKAGLTLEQQQVLLSIRNENERVKFLLKHFELLEKTLSKNKAIKRLIEGDGFIN